MDNIFRPQYRELSEEEKSKVDSIKDAAMTLYQLLPYGRGGALARTKLEESIMWAVKEITGPQAQTVTSGLQSRN